MRALLAAAVLLIQLPAAHAEVRAWNFRVLLDDREIGQHTFTVRELGEERELRSAASFEVRVLFLSAYRYEHEAIERWKGNCLRSLVSRTETNGEREEVSATARAGRLVVERPDRRDEHAGCVMSFAYWDPRILAARRLLNSQTGELLPVTVAAQGEETVAVRGRQVRAERHRITGPELSIDLWFAGEQWVALEASAKGGRRLRYELM
ncbi:MAG TPA: DUF6134 family protein [Steroidobacteraceae bacterium]|nr:DUF6134 family protein [Steroidobacteraceae bacterium]